MRRILYLSLAVVGSCIVTLAATVLAEGSSPPKVGWRMPQQVSQSYDAGSRRPDMAVDANGRIHVVWTEGTSGQEDPYYTSSEDQGNTWSDPDRLDTTLPSHQVSLSIGDTDTIHACWWDWDQQTIPWQYELLYANPSPSGWGVQETVVLTESDILAPSAAEANGYVYVVWSDKLSKHLDLYYSRKLLTDTVWLTPTLVVDTAASSKEARMAGDSSGNLHLVWEEYSDPTEILYISATVEAGQTTWSSPVTLSQDLSLHTHSPAIIVDNNDIVHTVFSAHEEGQPTVQDIYYAAFPVGSAQSVSPTVIPSSRVTVTSMLFTYAFPAVDVDGADNVHVAWNGKRGTDTWDRIYYAVSSDGGASWWGPVAVSPDDAWPDGLPTVATDATLVHVAWQERVSAADSDIWHSHSLPLVARFPLALKGY